MEFPYVNVVETTHGDLGRYIDLGVLGEGGMGEVRKVRDEILNRNLAMKIVHPSMLQNGKALARFLKKHKSNPTSTSKYYSHSQLVNFQTVDSISHERNQD